MSDPSRQEKFDAAVEFLSESEHLFREKLSRFKFPTACPSTCAVEFEAGREFDRVIAVLPPKLGWVVAFDTDLDRHQRVSRGLLRAVVAAFGYCSEALVSGSPTIFS